VTTQLRQQFTGGAKAASEARLAVEDLAAILPAPVLEDVRLLVSELVTNSVRHARLGTSGQIELVVDIAPDTVRVEVMDPGPGFERTEIVPSIYQTSGWGLYFVGEIADRWGVFNDGVTHVWFEMDLAKDPTVASIGG